MDEMSKEQFYRDEQDLAELRKHARFPIMEYATIYKDNPANSDRALIVDISLGGAQVRCRQEFQQGDRCVLQIGREQIAPFSIPVEIRYTQQIENQKLYAAGFQFCPRSKEEKAALVNYVHSLFLGYGETIVNDL